MDENARQYRRKTIRVDWHDYCTGWYFVTICTYNRICNFGSINSADPCFPTISLSPLGEYLQNNLEHISTHLPSAEIPLYTIMPNHIHFIIHIDEDENQEVRKKGERSMSKLGIAVRAIKSDITKYANQNNIPFSWQPRYYDHIIRNLKERNTIAQYILDNVANWANDKFIKCANIHQ